MLITVVFSPSRFKSISANELVHITVNFVMISFAEDWFLVPVLLTSLTRLHAVIKGSFDKRLRFFVEARISAIVFYWVLECLQ